MGERNYFQMLILNLRNKRGSNSSCLAVATVRLWQNTRSFWLNSWLICFSKHTKFLKIELTTEETLWCWWFGRRQQTKDKKIRQKCLNMFLPLNWWNDLVGWAIVICPPRITPICRFYSGPAAGLLVNHISWKGGVTTQSTPWTIGHDIHLVN